MPPKQKGVSGMTPKIDEHARINPKGEKEWKPSKKDIEAIFTLSTLILECVEWNHFN